MKIEKLARPSRSTIVAQLLLPISSKHTWVQARNV